MPAKPVLLGRRPVLRGMIGAAAGLGIPACASPAAGPPERLEGLVSILDYIPEALHAGILSASDTTDLTRHVQAAFDSGARLWAPAEARFHVRSVTIRGTGRFFDLNNALFVGIAAEPTTAIIELKCGHSEIRGLRVAANRSLLYRAAIHYFTSDSGADPVGYNRFAGGQADGAAIGLLIGGLPEQHRFVANRDPSGAAIDAPLSETTFSQWNLTGCIRGLYMNQPNGKLQFIGCHIAGEIADWKAPDTPRTMAAAIVIANPGSEIGIIGGSVEQLQEPRGRFVEVIDGSLTIDSATMETTASSFIAGAGRLLLSRMATGGFNSMTRPFVQARADCTGALTLSQFTLFMPPANAATGSNDLVRCVIDFDGAATTAPGLTVDLTNMELREARWSGGGEGLYPLVRGARVRIRQSRLTRYTSDGLRRVSDASIDDRADRLGGAIDRSAASLPPVDMHASASAGGWKIVSRGNARWGREKVGPDAHGLRLIAGSGILVATSQAFPIDRDRLFVFRGACRFAGTGSVAFRVAWLDYAGNEVRRDILFAGDPSKPAPIGAIQFLSLHATPAADAERAMLIVEVARQADLLLTQPSVN